MVLPVKSNQCYTGLGLFKSQRTYKYLHWLKSYGYYAEWVDFAYWWSCIRKDLRVQLVQQACFFCICHSHLTKSDILQGGI